MCYNLCVNDNTTWHSKCNWHASSRFWVSFIRWFRKWYPFFAITSGFWDKWVIFLLNRKKHAFWRPFRLKSLCNMNLKLLPSFRETIQLSIDVLCIHIGRLVRSVGYFKDFLFAHFLEFRGIGGRQQEINNTAWRSKCNWVGTIIIK